MDINAGVLNEGVEMKDLSDRIFEEMIQVASGEMSKGERAGISQVSIWRNWFLDDTQHLTDLQAQFNFEQKDLEKPGLKLKCLGGL